MRKGEVFSKTMTLTGSADQVDLASVVGTTVHKITQLILTLEESAAGDARVGGSNVSQAADPSAIGRPLDADGDRELVLVDVYYPSVYIDGTANDVVYISGVV